MPATESLKLRKAALVLHALSADDMTRVWQRLDEEQRDVLSPLLDELDSLGVPKGRQWLEGDTDSVDTEITEASMGNVDACRHAVSQLSASDALALLTAQSIDTAVAIMSMSSWPWLVEVVQNWPPEHRHTLSARLERAHALPARLSEQLLKTMALQAIKRPIVARPAPQTRRADRPAWYRGVMSLFMLT